MLLGACPLLLAWMVSQEERLVTMVTSPEMDQMVEAKLKELANRSEGMLFTMLGIDTLQMKPAVKWFMEAMVHDMVPFMENMFGSGDMFGGIAKMQQQLDDLMEVKLEELTPLRVKELVEDVIRIHLGWLVVWGNIFGGLIGVVSALAGY